MRILFTNIRLGMRTGTEVVVRDLALRLSERGHEVAVYSPSIGERAEELTSRGIPVVDNLLDIDRSPDVIHGHHMPITAEAIFAFPQTPVVSLCHGTNFWFDQPPRFPQVRRLLAVDETCRANLVASHHVRPEQVDILPNAVDLRRFVERANALPGKPRSAVSLTKHAGLAPLLQEACERCGLTFQAYGHGVKRPVDDIERLSASADIVFATARTALEAMAAGAAVILVDARGFGGLVTSANYELGRRLNFGVGMLTQETTLSGLIEAIGSYDALDAAAVSRRVRQEADLDLTVARLEDIYQSAIDEAARDPVVDPEAFRRAQTEFHRSWLMRLEPAGPRLLDQKQSQDELAVIHAHFAEAMERSKITIEGLTADIARAERSGAVRLAKLIRRWLGLLR